MKSNFSGELDIALDSIKLTRCEAIIEFDLAASYADTLGIILENTGGRKVYCRLFYPG